MKLDALSQSSNLPNDAVNISFLDKKTAGAFQTNAKLLVSENIRNTTVLDKPKQLFYAILSNPTMSSLTKAENIKSLLSKVGTRLGAMVLKQFVRAVFNIPSLVSKFGLPVVGVVVEILRDPTPVASATLSDVASAMLTERRNWNGADLKRYASITAEIYNPSSFTIGNCGPISHANVFNSMSEPGSRVFRNIAPDANDRMTFSKLTKNLGMRESKSITKAALESSPNGYESLLNEISSHTKDGKMAQLSIQGSPPIVANNVSTKAPLPKPGEVVKPYFSHPTNHAINVLQVNSKSGVKQLAILDSQTGTTVVGNTAVREYLRNVIGARVQFLYRYQP